MSLCWVKSSSSRVVSEDPVPVYLDCTIQTINIYRERDRVFLTMLELCEVQFFLHSRMSKRKGIKRGVPRPFPLKAQQGRPCRPVNRLI